MPHCGLCLRECRPLLDLLTKKHRKACLQPQVAPSVLGRMSPVPSSPTVRCRQKAEDLSEEVMGHVCCEGRLNLVATLVEAGSQDREDSCPAGCVWQPLAHLGMLCHPDLMQIMKHSQLTKPTV